MRTRFLVCYDIAHPKRLRRVEKTVKQFGSRLQYSIFECPLDDLGVEHLKSLLAGEINTDEDQIMFVSLGPAGNNASLRIDTLGLPYLQRSRVTVL
jgi:CRISPR-associated protein Cas2